jgi:transposase
MRVACSLCTHPKRAVIDKKLVNGASKLSIAQEFGVHRTTVTRHVAHLAGKLAKRVKEREDEHLDRLLEEIADDRRILTEAIDALRDPTTGLITAANAHKVSRMIKERRGGSELIAKAVGILAQQQEQEQPEVHAAIIVVPPPVPLGQPIPAHVLQPPRPAIEGPQDQDDQNVIDADVIEDNDQDEDQGDGDQG